MEIRLSYVDAVRNTRWMLERASHGSVVFVVRPGEDSDVVMISGAEYRRLLVNSMAVPLVYPDEAPEG